MRRGVQVSFEERNPTRDQALYSQYADLKQNINIDGVTCTLIFFGDPKKFTVL